VPGILAPEAAQITRCEMSVDSRHNYQKHQESGGDQQQNSRRNVAMRKESQRRIAFEYS
jgi:hypothetical protein